MVTVIRFVWSALKSLSSLHLVFVLKKKGGRNDDCCGFYYCIALFAEWTLVFTHTLALRSAARRWDLGPAPWVPRSGTAGCRAAARALGAAQRPLGGGDRPRSTKRVFFVVAKVVYFYTNQRYLRGHTPRR